MQIFTPRVGDTIRIGNGIEVTVISITDGQVRFNIKAPVGVRVRCEDSHPSDRAIHQDETTH
jgi:carbon storage regulator CsrA